MAVAKLQQPDHQQLAWRPLSGSLKQWNIIIGTDVRVCLPIGVQILADCFIQSIQQENKRLRPMFYERFVVFNTDYMWSLVIYLSRLKLCYHHPGEDRVAGAGGGQEVQDGQAHVLGHGLLQDGNRFCSCCSRIVNMLRGRGQTVGRVTGGQGCLLFTPPQCRSPADPIFFPIHYPYFSVKKATNHEKV